MSLNSDFPNAPTELRIALRILTVLAFLAGIAAAIFVVISLMSRSVILFLPSVAVCFWLFALGFALLKLKPWVRWGAPVLVYLIIFVVGIIMLSPFWVPRLDKPYPEIGEIALSALPIWTLAGLFIFGLVWCLWQLRAHGKSFEINIAAPRIPTKHVPETASSSLDKDNPEIAEDPGFVINLPERSHQVQQTAESVKPNLSPETNKTNIARKSNVWIVWLVLLPLGLGLVLLAFNASKDSARIKSLVQEGITLAQPHRKSLASICAGQALEPGMVNTTIGLAEPDAYQNEHTQSVRIDVSSATRASVTITYKQIRPEQLFAFREGIKAGQIIKMDLGCDAGRQTYEITGTVPKKFMPDSATQKFWPQYTFTEPPKFSSSTKKGVCSAELAGQGKRHDGSCFDDIHSRIKGPIMVVVPAGGGVDTPYAIGKYEVSGTDYNRYCSATKLCKTIPGTRRKLPITDISASEAMRYADWLSVVTSRESGENITYRLPTDNEWFHAALALGHQPEKNKIMCAVHSAYSIGLLGLINATSGSPNGWGLINHIGNAEEMVTVDSANFAARGGNFGDLLQFSADTLNQSVCSISLKRPFTGTGPTVGFRLVREIH